MTTGQDIVNAAYLVKDAPYREWRLGSPIPMWGYDEAGDPPPPEHIKYVGVMCSDLVSWAAMCCGLGPVYGTEALAYYLVDKQTFDPTTPGEPGAICLRPYSGPALVDQGHVGIYVDEHTLIQALYAPGVTDAYTDTETYSWGESTAFTIYGHLAGVDYSEDSGSAGEPVPRSLWEQFGWYEAINAQYDLVWHPKTIGE